MLLWPYERALRQLLGHGVADRADDARVLDPEEVVEASDRMTSPVWTLAGESRPTLTTVVRGRAPPAARKVFTHGSVSPRDTAHMWILFHVPTPTPDGQTAEDLYNKRVLRITAEMKDSARRHGCTFHRAWYAKDGSAFWAIAQWETAEGANAFFEEWEIDDEPGEEAWRLEGDVGLVPLPE